jgi:membrane protease YdiL (CAAX protease family)
MPQPRPQKIAAWWHLAVFLGIMAGIALMGFHAQQAGPADAGAAPAGQLIDHSQAIRNYLIDILGDCGLLYWCVAGVQWQRGSNLGQALEILSRGRWLTWNSLGRDLAIALPFWVIWEATAFGVHGLLALGGPDTARSTTSMLPQSWLEVLLWILVSLVAGVTEELQTRGYLQQQFHALSGSVVFAVLAQGLVFGVGHSYQGWRQVIVISVLGVLYGILAAWRKNLRANIIAHAWSDIWEGWLKMLLFP